MLTHGWSGSPAEMRGLGAYLAERGLTVRGVRLPGHGTDPRDLFSATWQGWAATCGQALHDLRGGCDTVFLGGLSMGALLSLYLGATARPPVAGVISMGAPIYFNDWRLAALPVLKHVVALAHQGAVGPRRPDRARPPLALPARAHALDPPTYLIAAEARRALPGSPRRC